MAAYTREEWNTIIRNVNELAASPPEETTCEPLSPLEEVGEMHQWAKSDIRAVRDKLSAICVDNSFTAELRLWSQDVIDEIEAAIAAGWCGCDEDEECVPDSEHGNEVVVYHSGGSIATNNCGSPEPPDISMCGLIHGMQVGQSGIYGRVWQLIYQASGSQDNSFIVSGGTIECNGTVRCTFDQNLTSYAGTVHVSCGSCGTPTCDAAIAAAEQHNAENPFSFVYKIRILGGDFCEPCEG